MLACWWEMEHLAVVEGSVVLSYSAPNTGYTNIYTETKTTVQNVGVCVRGYWRIEKKNLVSSSLTMLKVIFQNQWYFQKKNSSSGVFLDASWLSRTVFLSHITSAAVLSSAPSVETFRQLSLNVSLQPVNRTAEGGGLHVCSCLIPVQPWAAAAYQPTFVNN